MGTGASDLNDLELGRPSEPLGVGGAWSYPWSSCPLVSLRAGLASGLDSAYLPSRILTFTVPRDSGLGGGTGGLDGRSVLFPMDVLMSAQV